MAEVPDAADSSKNAAAAPAVEDQRAKDTAPTTSLGAEEFPDPDEDDLDDLDDMLDDFSAVKLNHSKAADDAPKIAATATETKPTPAQIEPSAAQIPDLGDAASEEAFAKQLQAGMADLLGEMEQSPEMQKQFEDIFKSMSAAMGESEGGATTSSQQTGEGPATESSRDHDPSMDASFQDTIRRTMERMQASGDKATEAAATGTEDDFMTELLKQMSSGDFNGEGSEEEFSKMLMGMMEQLTNKEILYEPMKELHDKFPEWLEKNRDKTSPEDLQRYEEQQGIVKDIVTKFEESSYSDSNTADREYIVDKMQKMQAAGSPPADLVGDMASAQDVFNGPDEQCNPQ